MLLLFTGFLPYACSAQVTANWTGAVSNNWNTSANWSTGAVPDSIDQVQIGLIPYTRQPQISSNQQAGSITFGGENPDTLTVNSGYTLQVNGAIFQNHAANNIAPLTLLKGAGSIVCDSLVVGNNTLPKVVLIKNTTLVSKVSSLTVNGKLRINSSTIDLLSGAIAHNNAIFSLNGGQLTLNGQIYLDNFIPAYLTSLPGKKPLSKFMISIDTNVNATLKLTEPSSITLLHSGYDSVDFYHPAGGSGKSIVNYAGGNQLLYTNNGGGIDTLPYTYQNLYVTTAGGKTAGNSTSGNKLTTAGDLIIHAGTLDLESFSATAIINGNFANRDTINVGSPGIAFRGPSFVNHGVFNYDDAWVTFSGGSQTLTDSTSSGTSLRFLAFADTGTKSINHGTFAIIPSGKVSLSNHVTVQVNTTGTFILQSDSTGTAAVTAIPAGSVLKGIVNAQWFVQGSWTDLTLRGYKIMSSAVNHTAQTNGTGDFNPNWLKGTTVYNGAIISGLNGHLNGFDTTRNPTLYIYREDIDTGNSAYTSGNYKGINQINNTDINNVGTQKRFTITEMADTTVRLHIGNGVLFYFRGNKVYHNGTTSGSKISTPYNYPESVTFNNNGTVNQGQVQVQLFYRSNNYLSYTDSTYIHNGKSRGQNQVGNPYPSAINWDNFSATDSTAAIYGPGLRDTVFTLNPLTHNYDAYGANPAHNRDSVYSGTGSATNILSSGEGFFVVVDSTSANRFTASLRFREAAKFNPPSTMGSMMMMMALRRSVKVTALKKTLAHKAAVVKAPGNANQFIRIMLMQGKSASDIVLVNFAKSSRAGLYLPADPDLTDNPASSLWTYSAVHRRVKVSTISLPVKSSMVTLNVNAVQSGSFLLDIHEIRNLAHYEVQLKDKLTGKILNARTQAKYAFSIDKANPKSFGDRFVLIITKIK